MRWATALMMLVCACDSDPETRSFSVIRNADTAPLVGKGDGPADATTSSDTRPTTQADSSIDDTTSPADSIAPTTAEPDVVVVPGEPSLVVAPIYAIPWVAAGGGASTLAVTLTNAGDAGPVDISVSGASAITVVDAPVSVGAVESAKFTLRFAGAPSASIISATLVVNTANTTATADVWAVAGDATLPTASWSNVTSGTITYGRSATVKLKTAPFPHASGSWTDDRVDIFVPDGFRARGPVDYVVHFHGFGATVAATLTSHKYREQLWASGANGILVTPQGPVNASSGNFGKLMIDGGLAAMLRDVTSILYRSGVIDVPQSGDAVLTEHSGGYQAVAENLDETFDQGQVLQAHLYDGLYARQDQYLAFANAGGWIRSDYSTAGGTLANNQGLVDDLPGRVDEARTFEGLRDADHVIWFTHAAHNETTWWLNAYAETLRWSATHSRRGPRIELRSAVAHGGTATVSWLSPLDDDLIGFAVESASLSGAWSEVARVDADASSATFSVSGGVRVRVVPLMDGVSRAQSLPSDEYWLQNDGDVLVVDGFDRILGGSWKDLRHGFMARVGAAAHAHMISNEAVSEDDFDLSDYRVVIWLVGDESVADQTFDSVEQLRAKAYVDGGGHLIVSGSEVAFDLKSNGSSFLTSLGATFSSDDSNGTSVKGVGSLQSMGSAAFGGAAAPYPEDFPDVLGTASGAVAVLQYNNGMTAAVGRSGKSALVGFPLETIEQQGDLEKVVAALVGFVAP